MSHRRGAPLGNQNARKHGFYSEILDPDERRYLKYAGGVKGLDEEISLLRVKIKSVADHDPDNLRLLSTAASALARLLKAREKLTAKLSTGEQIHDAIGNVIREIGLPLLGEKLLIDSFQPAENQRIQHSESR